MNKLIKLFISTLVLFGISAGILHAQKRTIAVMTPFLAQPGTQLMVEAFETAAKAKSWEVNVIDTSGDVAALVSRMEDVSLQKVARSKSMVKEDLQKWGIPLKKVEELTGFSQSHVSLVLAGKRKNNKIMTTAWELLQQKKKELRGELIGTNSRN